MILSRPSLYAALLAATLVPSSTVSALAGERQDAESTAMEIKDESHDSKYELLDDKGEFLPELKENRHPDSALKAETTSDRDSTYLFTQDKRIEAKHKSARD